MCYRLSECMRLMVLHHSSTRDRLLTLLYWIFTSCRNPWDKNKLGDMGEDDYKRFICVEAAQNSRRIHIGRDETWTATHVVTLA